MIRRSKRVARDASRTQRHPMHNTSESVFFFCFGFFFLARQCVIVLESGAGGDGQGRRDEAKRHNAQRANIPRRGGTEAGTRQTPPGRRQRARAPIQRVCVRRTCDPGSSTPSFVLPYTPRNQPEKQTHSEHVLREVDRDGLATRTNGNRH